MSGMFIETPSTEWPVSDPCIQLPRRRGLGDEQARIAIAPRATDEKCLRNDGANERQKQENRR